MRSPGGVRRQPGNASAAAEAARSMSDFEESGTLAMTSAVAGFVTGSSSREAGAVQPPPT